MRAGAAGRLQVDFHRLEGDEERGVLNFFLVTLSIIIFETANVLIPRLDCQIRWSFMTKTEGALKDSTTAVPCYMLAKCAGNGLLATSDAMQCLGKTLSDMAVTKLEP